MVVVVVVRFKRSALGVTAVRLFGVSTCRTFLFFNFLAHSRQYKPHVHGNVDSLVHNFFQAKLCMSCFRHVFFFKVMDKSLIPLAQFLTIKNSYPVTHTQKVGFLGHIFHCVSLFHAIKVNTSPRHKHCYITFHLLKETVPSVNLPVCIARYLIVYPVEYIVAFPFPTIRFQRQLFYLCHKSFGITFNPLKSYFSCVCWLGHKSVLKTMLRVIYYTQSTKLYPVVPSNRHILYL